ncbi:MAG: glycosyltransferase involved in cell wall biosynthesis [Pseudohongiellaceae bacterium]
MSKKVLSINVFFSPQSFGGGTIIAEQMAFNLQAEQGWDVAAACTMRAELLPYYALRRYKSKAIDVFAINVPGGVSYQESYRNGYISSLIGDVLDSLCPDVVHIHSIQTLGCEFFDVFVDKKIPFAVTLHDCWWLCERQFMIDGNGQHCFQKQIDQNRCRYCVGDYSESIVRSRYLKAQLEKADMLLFPSEYHRNLYLENGIDAKKAVLNKNGIKLPAVSFSKKPRQEKDIIFGFVGGPGPGKGADLILKAFNEISRTDYKLQIVDAARHVGTTWRNGSYWQVPGNLEVVAPYTQETIDDFFAGIDVLLFPSQVKESFGLTVREALARDVWVISTDAGGVVEDLRHSENSTLIPLDGDYRKLKLAIEGCLEMDDWGSYVNPYKLEIRGYSEQAAELSVLLENIIN